MRKNVYQGRELFLKNVTPLVLIKGNKKKLRNVRFSINLCWRGHFWRHRNNNVDRETCPNISIHFLKPCGETNFPLQFCLHYLVASSIGTPEGLASRSKTQIVLLFLENKTTIKIKLGRIVEMLNQRHNQRGQMRSSDINVEDCENENWVSNQLLQIQNKSFNWSPGVFETFLQRFFCVWRQQWKLKFNLIKLYLLPILVNELDIEPTVIKKANQFI